MTLYTPQHLEMFARGERLPQEVFNAIVHDPGTLTRVYQLMRVRALFTEEDSLVPADVDATQEDAATFANEQLPGMERDIAAEKLSGH